MKRLLYQVHRWVGIVLALFMLLWFFTGLVILYSPASTLSRSQQQARAETLSMDASWLTLDDAWRLSAAERKEAARQSRVDGEGRRRAGGRRPGQGGPR